MHAKCAVLVLSDPIAVLLPGEEHKFVKYLSKAPARTHSPHTNTLCLVCITGSLAVLTRAGHFLNADGTPYDPYHELHLPHDPPLYPTLDRVPLTAFSCEGRDWGLHADTEANCQVKDSVVSRGNGNLLANICVVSRVETWGLHADTEANCQVKDSVVSRGNGNLLANICVVSRVETGDSTQIRRLTVR